MGGGGERPSPEPIIRMASAYWTSCVLLTANRLGVVNTIGDGHKSAAALAEALGLSAYPVDNFLDALVSLGYLERRDDGYANSALSRTFLVQSSPAYLGNVLRYSDDLYPIWGKLGETLKTGKPA